MIDKHIQYTQNTQPNPSPPPASDVRRLILVRYAELFLKGNNRSFFERLLLRHLRHAVSEAEGTRIVSTRGRILIEGYAPDREQMLLSRLGRVFGVHSYSPALSVPARYDDILAAAKSVCPRRGTFKVATTRADKRFPLNSMQMSAQLGGDLLTAFPELRVDVHTPSFTVHTDIRDTGRAFVFSEVLSGAGGMPAGSAGKGLLLLSGGIDSPVAGHMMMKRGLSLSAVHFFSYPYTGEQARQKVVELTRALTRYAGGAMDLYMVPFTAIQEAIHERCHAEYMVILMRRFMTAIAQRIAGDIGAGALVSGENLGQVASQTLESLTVTGSGIGLPFFRPLIAFDKMDIVAAAQKIGTYDISVLPYEDCCTVFLPPHPIIKPTLAHTEREEAKLDKPALIEAAVQATEKMRIE